MVTEVISQDDLTGSEATMMDGGTMMGWGGGLWMWLGMVVFWVGIIAVIAYAIRGGRSTGTGDGYRGPSAREILEERFARGEISEDELRDRKQVLARHAP